MASKMEQIIDDIEEYIEGCKFQALSSTKIIVNKDELVELLGELKSKTPEEIKRYQKIISNKEAILADAQAKADAIIAQAQVKTDELVSEHQIMQQAYAQANEVVLIARKQAQDTVNDAATQANEIRLGAMKYADDILKNLESVISRSMEAAKVRHDSYISSLQEFYDIVAANRAELNPMADDAEETNQASAPAASEELPKVDVTPDML